MYLESESLGYGAEQRALTQGEKGPGPVTKRAWLALGEGRGRRGRPEGPGVGVTTAQGSSLSSGGSDPDLPVPGERLPRSIKKVSVFFDRGRGTGSGFWAMLLSVPALPCPDHIALLTPEEQVSPAGMFVRDTSPRRLSFMKMSVSVCVRCCGGGV